MRNEGKNRQIAQLDGTLNEVVGLNVGEGAPVKGYPTLRYYPSATDLRESHAGSARCAHSLYFWSLPIGKCTICP